MLKKPTELASSVENIYSRFQSALKGAVFDATKAKHSQTKASRAELFVRARNIAHSSLEEITSVVSSISEEVAAHAKTDSGVTLSEQDAMTIDDHIHGLVESTISLIEQQLFRDTLLASKWFKDFSFRVGMLTLAPGHNEKSAAIKAEQELLPSLRLGYVDRLGRSWKSSRYVSTLSASLFMDIYNLTFMFSLQKSNVETCRLVSGNPKRNGLVISISEQVGDAPTYESVKDSHFHPQSNTLVQL